MDTATTTTKFRLIILSVLLAIATCICGVGCHRESQKAHTAEQSCKVLSDSLNYWQNEAVKKCLESNRELRDWYQEQQQTKREMEAIRNNKPSWLR